MYSKQKCILCPSAEDMRGLAGCPKIQKSKNPSFQTESLDSGQKDGFLDFPRFFWIFLDSSKGCLDFWVSKSKIQKNSRKRWIFAKIQFLPAFFWIFWKNQSFSLSFFRFLISGLEKSIFFLGFYGFLQKSIFFLGFFIFFENFIFFLEFFWIFDLETQKSKHPFEESQKNPKKPWEIQKSIFLT